MKSLYALGLILGLVAAAGCSKKESPATVAPTESVAAASAPAMEKKVATAKAPETQMSAPAAVVAPAVVVVPDLKTTSVAQLVSTSSKALTSLTTLAGTSQPAVAQQVEAVQAAMAANEPVDALAKLKQLAASAQAIPGAPIVIESTKQLVSAWALKQGFDTAKIAPVLGALQAKDFAGLASHAAQLMGAGGLTDQQKALVNGVLSAYGIDAKADQLMSKVKGLLH